MKHKDFKIYEVLKGYSPLFLTLKRSPTRRFLNEITDAICVIQLREIRSPDVASFIRRKYQLVFWNIFSFHESCYLQSCPWKNKIAENSCRRCYKKLINNENITLQKYIRRNSFLAKS